MNGIDLNQFQFDYDQTWAVMFLRADGSVLARYGSRNSTDAMTLNSMEGFKSTMQRVLAAHYQWPEQQELYRQKRGPNVSYEHAEDIPSATINRVLARKENERTSCIHCHNVYDAYRDVDISKGTYDPRRRWKYPQPESVGFSVDPVTGSEVRAVESDSAAATAGLQHGDLLQSLNNQRIHSLADIQFALHFVPEEATVPLTIQRGDSIIPSELRLRPGWREGDISWRVSMYGMPPSPGLWIQEASSEEKRRLGLNDETMALKVRGVFGDDVKRSELKQGDIIVEADGLRGYWTPGEFHSYLRLNHYQPQSELSVKVKRGDRELPVKVLFRNE